ncbi:putative TolC family protein [Candidatus Magnetomoraceae bacterium gMMP-13]
MFLIHQNNNLFNQSTKVSLNFDPVSFPEERSQHSNKNDLKLLDAVRITLVNQPDIHLKEKQVILQEARLQAETGKFDINLELTLGRYHEEQPLSDFEKAFQNTSEIERDTTSYSVNLSKQFRNGVKISPGLTTNRNHEDPSNSDIKYESKIDFPVTVPLLKGRGRESAAANEMALKKEYEISQLQLRYSISRNVFNTVSAYWQYVAAWKNFEQLKASEARAEILVKEVKTFIKANKRPAADLEQMLANLADKTASRIAGEQSLFESRQYLGLAIGLTLDNIKSLHLPAEDFPEISVRNIISKLSLSKKFIKHALDFRADYLASKEQQSFEEILFDAAKNNLKPRLDLNLSVGYSGLNESSDYSKFITTPGDASGLNGSMSINYKWPFKNNTAKGLLLERKSSYDQSVISTNNLARNISSNVLVCIFSIKNSALELERARQAVRSYKTAVNNEKKKFRLGISTLLDLISIEDRLTNALLNKISAQLKFSNAVIRLRFETGTILGTKKGQVSVTINELTTIPKF